MPIPVALLPLSLMFYSDEDCGGLTILDANGNFVTTAGGTCNSDCNCVCDSAFCLSKRPTNGQDATKDISCQFDCTCRKQCALDEAFKNSFSSFNLTHIATYSEGDRCQGQCTDCTSDANSASDSTSDPNKCGTDEDCIDNGDNTATCVEAGICTAKKDDMCDDAYAAVSGKKNKRAKCCPDTRYVYMLLSALRRNSRSIWSCFGFTLHLTFNALPPLLGDFCVHSGCIKSAIGVVATSTCGNTCGFACRGSESNPGNAYGYSPSTFCTFGERVENMPYCPIVASNYTSSENSNLGILSCTESSSQGGTDSTGDDSICCSDTTHKGATGDSVNGGWNCGEGTAGNTTQYALGWPGSPDGAYMCIRDDGSKSSRHDNSSSTPVCP